MTEPVSQKELPAAPESTPPRAKSRWGLWLSTLMLLLIAGGAAGAYWFGWPWFQQQWQRFEVLEREVAKAAEPGPDVVATCAYGDDLVAAVGRDHVWACQFHPEKSGRNGLRILENFVAAARAA